jgi:hypothetical protein
MKPHCVHGEATSKLLKLDKNDNDNNIDIKSQTSM